jgi:hypothetical protein
VNDGMAIEFIHGSHDAVLEFLFGCDADVAQHRAGELGEEALGKCCPASDKNGQIICCSPYSMDQPPYNTMTYGCHHSAACLPILK